MSFEVLTLFTSGEHISQLYAAHCHALPACQSARLAHLGPSRQQISAPGSFGVRETRTEDERVSYARLLSRNGSLPLCPHSILNLMHGWRYLSRAKKNCRSYCPQASRQTRHPGRGEWGKLAGGVKWPPPTCAVSDEREWGNSSRYLVICPC